MTFLSLFTNSLLLTLLSGDLGEAFSLKGEVIEALEGGPLVLSLTLDYQGEGPIEVMSYCINEPSPVLDFSAPEGWGPKEPFIGMSRTITRASLVRYHSLKSGDRFSTTVCLQEWFREIPAGRVVLGVTWKVVFKDQRELKTTTKLDFEVLTATAERLAEARRRIESTLDRPGLKMEAKEGLSTEILRTKHSAFVPTALRMVASAERYFPHYDLIDFAYKRTDSADEVHDRLVELACNSNWDNEFPAFNYWMRNHIVLPSRCFQKLANAPSVWTRALTYATFPKGCDPAWSKQLLRELGEVHAALPADRWAQVVRRLDDDDFAVRERATLDLEGLGFHVEGQLRQALEGKPSAEVRERARRVLDKLAAKQSPPKCAEALRFLGGTNTPEATAMLEVLAKGPPDSWLTKEASALLAKRGKPAKDP